MAGQSTAMTKHRAQLVEDASCKPDTRKPMVDTVSPTDGLFSTEAQYFIHEYQ